MLTHCPIWILACAGVKNMLAGEQQAAVTVAVEGLMDAKPIPELEAFATFDPKVVPIVLHHQSEGMRQYRIELDKKC